MPIKVALPDGFIDMYEYMDALIAFLKPRRHWWEYHSTSQFIDDFWSHSVPKDWREPMLQLSLEDLLELATHGLDASKTVLFGFGSHVE